MNKFDSLTFRRFAGISTGLLLTIFAGFHFLNVPVRTESMGHSPAQNLVLGRLAYSTLTGTASGQVAGISTANADGSGAVGVTNFPPVSDPSWAPDGRIVYVQFGAGSEIFVMNANGTNQVNLTNSMNISEGNPSWSVLGKIVYEREGQIWTMNADGSGQAVFSAIAQPAPTGPAWSADGTKLAFASGGEIWKINADGTNETRVTTNVTVDKEPAWSPDGSKIVFARTGGGLSVINADGTGEAPLTVSGDVKPAWSPDGTTIAFRRDAALAGIYLMDVNGGNQIRIIADTSGSFGTTHDNPAWQPVAQTPNTFTISGRITRRGLGMQGAIVNLSGTINAITTTDAVGNYQLSGLPAGGNYLVSPSFLNHTFAPANQTVNNLNANRIADFTGSRVCIGFVCADNGKIAFVRDGEIFTINQDQSGLTNVTNNGADDAGPEWSPDGGRIVFYTNRDGNYEIYRKNSEGDNNPTRLTNNPASDIQPRYSPDGASIVFASNRDGNNEIYKMNADGSNQVRLTNDAASDQFPSFSPDGSKILFIRGTIPQFTLLTMNTDGSSPQPILGPSNYMAFPSYSPDGTKIIMSWGTDITTQNIYFLNANGTGLMQAPFGRSYPAYSPDGTKVVHNCCFSGGIPTPNGLFTTPVGSNEMQRLTTHNSSDYQPDWQPLRGARRAAFDFDGDARADVSFFRPTGGVWFILRSTDGLWTPQWGLSTDVLVPGDYDGDLKTDVAVWRESDNNFYVLNSFDGTVRIENFGLAGDVPTGGDWDGDGKADVAVYRGGAQGVFYYRASMGNPQRNITSIPWGVPGDKSVVGDYDGDGLVDAAVFRPSNGIWYIRKSSDGQLIGYHFGVASDTLAPADYDADGKTDLAVYRGGTWYLLRTTLGFTAFQFGIAGDIPAPADYDGDGRADVAVYRNGVWWSMRSQTGNVEAFSFGSSTDKPIPSAFVR